LNLQHSNFPPQIIQSPVIASTAKQRGFFVPGTLFNPSFIVSLKSNSIIMIQSALLGMLGTNEIIIILVIVLLLFGGRKIPELMRGLGKGVREFNDAKTNVKKEIEESASDVKNSVKE
jgi:sec-independent protein translocase protein TatA